jgi:hypothetical protein
MALATETRTDAEIQSEVFAELKFEPRLQPSESASPSRTAW